MISNFVKSTELRSSESLLLEKIENLTVTLQSQHGENQFKNDDLQRKFTSLSQTVVNLQNGTDGKSRKLSCEMTELQKSLEDIQDRIKQSVKR